MNFLDNQDQIESSCKRIKKGAEFDIQSEKESRQDIPSEEKQILMEEPGPSSFAEAEVWIKEEQNSCEEDFPSGLPDVAEAELWIKEEKNSCEVDSTSGLAGAVETEVCIKAEENSCKESSASETRMASGNNFFNLNNKKNIARLQEELFHRGATDEEDFGDDSDTECEDEIEEREDNSESEQSGDTESDEDWEDDDLYYTAFQKKGKKIINTYKWRKIPLSNKKKLAKKNLLGNVPGVRGPAREAKSVLDSWLCMINMAMIQKITSYTNDHIEEIKKEYKRPRDARTTDETEIKAFIGLLYLAGIFCASRVNLEELWDTNGDGIEAFRLTMSLKRFSFLMRCIRFDNKSDRDERKKIDRLAAVRDIFEMFVDNCKQSYSHSDHVTIDEKLEGFRGRCSFRQYIPSKLARYGIKLFATVDSILYYTSNLEIYAGKQPEGPYAVSNNSTEVVKRLVSHIRNTGRNVTADSWFSDVSLLEELSASQLSFVGALKKSKWQIPLQIKNVKNRAVHSSLYGFRKEGTIVSYVPTKNKNIILISSLHFNDSTDDYSGENAKPAIITFYNETKGAVDTMDKLCATYNVARNTRRWPMVIFFSMLNIAGINSQIIYRSNGYKVKSRRKYLRELSLELRRDHMVRRSTSGTSIHRGLRDRLREVAPVQNSTQRIENSFTCPGKRRSCEPCKDNKHRRNTKYCCRVCSKYLCLEHINAMCQDCFSVIGQGNVVSNEIEDNSDSF